MAIKRRDSLGRWNGPGEGLGDFLTEHLLIPVASWLRPGPELFLLRERSVSLLSSGGVFKVPNPESPLENCSWAPGTVFLQLGSCTSLPCAPISAFPRCAGCGPLRGITSPLGRSHAEHTWGPSVLFPSFPCVISSVSLVSPLPMTGKSGALFSGGDTVPLVLR